MSHDSWAVACTVIAASLFSFPALSEVSSSKLESGEAQSGHVAPGSVPSGTVPSGEIPPAQVRAGALQIAPINSRPLGKSYSQWAAEWWQWALEAPTDDNPLIDQTGENCATNQRGHVWFLAGTLGGGEVTRSCTIPSGTALFFPIVNAFYAASVNDPPEQRTEEYCRDQIEDVDGNYSLALQVDGRSVQNLDRFFERSVIFDLRLPEDNIFGITDLEYSPSCDEGYYVFLRPLPPGEHVIKWTAQPSSGANVQDVTYNITILPGRSASSKAPVTP